MHKIWTALLVAALSGGAGCAEIAPPEWPKACVGRLQLNLPGEADQAAYLFKDMFKNRAQYSGPFMRFPDGEMAEWTDFPIVDITHPLTSDEKPEALKAFQAILDRVEKRNKAKVEKLPTGKYIGQAWILPNRRIGLDVIVNDSVFLWGLETESEVDFTQANEKLNSLINALRPRPLFDVPTETGLCLPYLFIPDSGQEKHAIAMTYRLKEHPDITINLKSESAASTPKEGDPIRPDAVTNDFQTDLYWGAKLASNLKTARSLWHLPAKRSMQLAGRAGLETFLAVVRLDATEEDYIYHAVARGNPDTPELAPDVRLVVEQKKQNAIKRGIKPLTQDEVLKLARQIAASVGARKNQ
jgi:hypothetical protein